MLVNNAGVMRNVSILDSTQRDVDLCFTSTLFAFSLGLTLATELTTSTSRHTTTLSRHSSPKCSSRSTATSSFAASSLAPPFPNPPPTPDRRLYGLLRSIRLHCRLSVPSPPPTLPLTPTQTVPPKPPPSPSTKASPKSSSTSTTRQLSALRSSAQVTSRQLSSKGSRRSSPRSCCRVWRRTRWRCCWLSACWMGSPRCVWGLGKGAGLMRCSTSWRLGEQISRRRCGCCQLGFTCFRWGELVAFFEVDSS